MQHFCKSQGTAAALHHAQRRPAPFFKRALLVAAFSCVFFAGCAIFSPHATSPKPRPVPARRYSDQDTAGLSSTAKFFYKFAFSKREQKPMGLRQVVDDYLPQNLFWVTFNGAFADGKVIAKEHNTATAFHIGGGYFLTAAHAVSGMKDRSWTSNRPVAKVFYITGENRYALVADDMAAAHSLSSPTADGCYSFRVVFRDSQLDVAVLEADSSFGCGKGEPLIHFDTTAIAPGDTIVHFVNGLYARELAFLPACENRTSRIAVKNSEGRGILWGEWTPLRSSVPPYLWYLRAEGYSFELTHDELEKRTLFTGVAGGSPDFSIATTFSINGNSGAPLFRKNGNGYMLAGVVVSGPSSRQFHEIYGAAWQVNATQFPRSARMQEFFWRIIGATANAPAQK